MSINPSIALQLWDRVKFVPTRSVLSCQRFFRLNAFVDHGGSAVGGGASVGRLIVVTMIRVTGACRGGAGGVWSKQPKRIFSLSTRSRQPASRHDGNSASLVYWFSFFAGRHHCVVVPATTPIRMSDPNSNAPLPEGWSREYSNSQKRHYYYRKCQR